MLKFNPWCHDCSTTWYASESRKRINNLIAIINNDLVQYCKAVVEVPTAYGNGTVEIYRNYTIVCIPFVDEVYNHTRTEKGTYLHHEICELLIWKVHEEMGMSPDIDI